MKFPVFDLHCDTAYTMLGKSYRELGDLRRNNLHIDLEKAGNLSGYAQCFACFTTPKENIDPVVLFERELATILSQIEKNKDKIRLAYSANDVLKNFEKGLMSAILTLEGTAGFGYDPDMLEDLYKVGFRITSLGWNEKNTLTGSHVTGGGLTEQGRDYVHTAQKFKMLIDVSHISDEGFWDVMDITDGPVIATHSNSRAICNVSRNLTDDMFRAICSTGGVAGINLFPEFLGTDVSLDTVCDHIFHFLELDPTGKHIALGGDLDGVAALPRGFRDVSDYNALAEALLTRGLDVKMVQDIFWNNILGVMGRCCT